MRIALGFHDVVEDEAPVRPIAAGHTTLYTLARSRLREHLRAIRERAGSPPNVIFTFDDGTAGSYTCAAEELERLGWAGHFFIVTDWIGRPGFLDAGQIRDLHRRGHIVGSHSCSHPLDMTRMEWNELVREWSASRAILSAIVDVPVTVASLPNGHYCPKIAEAAAAAGIEVLLTSVPTASEWRVDRCLVLGRYCVRRSTPVKVAAAIAAGARWPRMGQALAWSLKKGLRRVAGPWYRRLRESWPAGRTAGERRI